ncbi:unnamed protein product [Owenia fusiformis]|uniref:Uncharacterized protein n=1 Tax=Owenia fusiformis TaxID=6347 RepID=A0A8J1XW06_OWEFU|nr:unnamed protein product [Owenia fusiformis]
METLCLLGLVCVLPVCFAGMAFPVKSTTFTVDAFSKINPDIEWDPTNFLVDLSGPYTLCKHSTDYGEMKVFEKTQSGGNIGGMIESTLSSGETADQADIDIRRVMSTWVNKSPFREQIKKATRFGCSIQPGCIDGTAVIGCLFTPKINGKINPPTRIPGPPVPGTRRPVPTFRPPPVYPTPNYDQRAVAFTKEQYETAETITGSDWDTSHFLENLSGFETTCDMIGQNDWSFSKARDLAADRGVNIFGVFGSAPIYDDDTTEAIATILYSWDTIVAEKAGCSAIPDCIDEDGAMITVVSCLFREE